MFMILYLPSVNKQLAACPSASMSSSKAPYRPAQPSKANHDKPPEAQARLSRESTERERVLELIQRKKTRNGRQRNPKCCIE
jgi:hypothetical protein